jgi:hypothetical protein
LEASLRKFSAFSLSFSLSTLDFSLRDACCVKKTQLQLWWMGTMAVEKEFDENKRPRTLYCADFSLRRAAALVFFS